MKRIVLVGGLVIALMLEACTSVGLLESASPVEGSMEISMEPTQPTGPVVLPSNALGIFQGSIKFGVYPYILRPGDIVDTWTELDETPELGHNRGDPIALKIWNGYGEPVAIDVSWLPGSSYRDRVGDTDICRDSDGEYAIAPEYVKDWFTFSPGRYIIPAKTVLGLPLSFHIPKDATLKGRHILQIGIVRIPSTSGGMGFTEGYVFKLKLEFEQR